MSMDDDVFTQHSSQFAGSLKDLKNLRTQLYSAAEYFESSYVKEDRKQLYGKGPIFCYEFEGICTALAYSVYSLVEGSKDYVVKALVHTIDHLGSMADKLNKFFDEKTKEVADTDLRLSSIQQRLNVFQAFLDLRGPSKESMKKHYKKYNISAADDVRSAESKFLHKKWIPQSDTHQPEQIRMSGTTPYRSMSPSPPNNKYKNQDEPFHRADDMR